MQGASRHRATSNVTSSFTSLQNFDVRPKMVQTRVCSYYKSPGTSCTHVTRAPTTFLSLPERSRHQIYRQAGLPNGASVRFKGKHGVPFSYDDSTDAPAFASYYNLRLVSRFVSTDVTGFLCSHNETLLCCEDFTDLSILLDVAAVLVKSLGRLIIHLNVSSCNGPMCDFCRWHPVYARCRKPPLKSTSRRFQAIAPVWRKVVDRLALWGDFSKLKLNLICDVGDITTAHLITEPIEQSRLPTGTIRLGSNRNAMLEDIALQVVHCSAAGINDRRKSFRFLDLPTELRWHILSFTDLVAPLRQIEWSPRAKFTLRGSEAMHGPCTNRGFCHRQHAVYPHCDCWVLPIPMFLVCRDMLQDARATFYASNRFIIAPSSSDWRPNFRDKPFEASIFLTKVVPPKALSYLRDLEVIFPATEYNFRGIDQAVYNDWVRTIEYVAPRLKKLALQLYMGFELTPYTDPLRSVNIQGSQNALFRIHEQIVRPLSQLECLDCFFVCADSPFSHPRWTWKTIEQQIKDHEKRLEGLVMGSAYDSKAEGKMQRERSEWMNTDIC